MEGERKRLSNATTLLRRALLAEARDAFGLNTVPVSIIGSAWSRSCGRGSRGISQRDEKRNNHAHEHQDGADQIPESCGRQPARVCGHPGHES